MDSEIARTVHLTNCQNRSQSGGIGHTVLTVEHWLSEWRLRTHLFINKSELILIHFAIILIIFMGLESSISGLIRSVILCRLSVQSSQLSLTPLPVVSNDFCQDSWLKVLFLSDINRKLISVLSVRDSNTCQQWISHLWPDSSAYCAHS